MNQSLQVECSEESELAGRISRGIRACRENFPRNQSLQVELSDESELALIIFRGIRACRETFPRNQSLQGEFSDESESVCSEMFKANTAVPLLGTVFRHVVIVGLAKVPTVWVNALSGFFAFTNSNYQEN